MSARTWLFNGKDGLLKSAGVYVLIDQGMKWRRYGRGVGAANTSIHGFRVWKTQMRTLIKAQPRISVPRGLVGLAGVPVFWALAAIPGIGPLAVLFGLLVLVSGLYGIGNLMHRAPPAGWVALINAGCPPWSPGDAAYVISLMRQEPPWAEMLKNQANTPRGYDNWIRLAERMAQGRGPYRRPAAGPRPAAAAPGPAAAAPGPAYSQAQLADMKLLHLTTMPADAAGLVRAMRKQAMTDHPDHKGGSVTAFEAMFAAYERLLQNYPREGQAA